MHLPRRIAVRCPRQLLRQQQLQQQQRLQQRRFASHDSHHHSEPVKENIGMSFFVVAAALPVSYLIYKSTIPSDPALEPWPTRLLRKFDYLQEVYAERNDIHTRLVQQAASDRILFMNSGEVAERRYARFNPETLNSSCPHNVRAGWGSINLEKVTAHYEKQNAEQDAKGVERLKRKLEKDSD